MLILEKPNKYISAIKIILFISLLLTGLTLLNPRTTYAFSGGSGASDDPYQITTPAELASMTSYLGSGNSGKYFKLMNDIDLDVSPYNTGSGWTPIGNSSSNFYGKFDGDGHSISGLYINRTTSYGGLFGYTQGATIQNVSLTGANVTSTATYTGILVGRAYNNNTISGVSASGTISSSSNYVGGLIGSMHSGVITNANSSAAVTGAQYVGGLLGEINGTTLTNPDISDSYATGDIRADSYIGGFVGYKVYGAVSRSYASGDILGDRTGGLTNDYGGGFVGAVCYGSIVRSYATGNIYGDNELAGFGGLSHNCSGTTITDNYARGDVYPSVSGTGGGFMRYNYLATVQRNFSTGLVDGQTNAGFIYWDVGCGGCSNNYWDTQTSGQSTGGLFAGGGATGKNTLQMKTVDTYTTSNAWDFVGNPINDVANNDYWDINGTTNDGYPFLAWQSANSNPDTPDISATNSDFTVGDWQQDTTPTFSMTLADDNVSDTVKYTIEVDDSSDFGSPVVEYTSALAAQGEVSFTLGQAAGSGTYTTGSEGQTLGEAQYYWRVKSIDENDAESSYTTANSGGVAFGVDTAVPTTPGTPSTTTPTSDTTPTWTWTASTDSGSGLSSSQTYILSYSQDADFDSYTSTDVLTNSFTHGTPLGEGTWYVRVAALDNVGRTSTISDTATILVDTSSPTVPGTPSMPASATNDTTPTWTWTASTDSGAGLHSTPYTFYFSMDSDFSSGSFSTASSNSFTHSSPLSEGRWYARLTARDAVANTSANSSSGSVYIDTTAPTTPGKPAPSTSNSDDTPSWTWTASTDSGSGLASSEKYTIQWSKSSTFASGVYTTTSNTNSFTHSSSLADGTWYFRVKSNDSATNQSGYSTKGSITIDTTIETQDSEASSSDSQATDATIEFFSAIIDNTKQDQQKPVTIILDDFPEYRSAGKKIRVNEGQLLYFCANNTKSCKDSNKHSITIDSIDLINKTVTVTVRSTPQTYTFALNDQKKVDVDYDGEPDIEISLSYLGIDHAGFKFKGLAAASSGAVQTTESNNTVNKSNSTARQWVAVAVVVIVGILVTKTIKAKRLRASK